MLKDSFGCYEVTFYYYESANKKNYEFRKYVNSKKIKSLGGMYAIYCEEDNSIIFRKSEYLRDRSYSKFSEGLCEDAKKYSEDIVIPMELKGKIQNSYEYDSKIVSNYIEWANKAYHLPTYIDKTKLTEEEFQTLRKLIKKSLP